MPGFALTFHTVSQLVDRSYSAYKKGPAREVPNPTNAVGGSQPLRGCSHIHHCRGRYSRAHGEPPNLVGLSLIACYIQAQLKQDPAGTASVNKGGADSGGRILLTESILTRRKLL